MPIVIDGYIAVSAKDLSAHKDHPLVVPDDDLGVRIWCGTCATEIAREHRSTLLPCGCATQAEHDEGKEMQERTIRHLRSKRIAWPGGCVGCYLGDDGPSMHSCYIHR